MRKSILYLYRRCEKKGIDICLVNKYYDPVNFPVEGVRASACSGTPSDSARAGIRHLMPIKPAVLLSGINYAYYTSLKLSIPENG